MKTSENKIPICYGYFVFLLQITLFDLDFYTKLEVSYDVQKYQPPPIPKDRVWPS